MKTLSTSPLVMKFGLSVVARKVPPLKLSSAVGAALAAITPPIASVPFVLRFITFNAPALLIVARSSTYAVFAGPTIEPPLKMLITQSALVDPQLKPILEPPTTPAQRIEQLPETFRTPELLV